MTNEMSAWMIKKCGLQGHKSDVMIIALMAIYKLIKCPVRFLSGIPCPGCGMTRAVIALLRLDFREAYLYHPLVFAIPAVAIWALASKHLSKRLNSALTVFCLIILAAVYFVRISDGTLAVDVCGGLFYRLLDI